MTRIKICGIDTPETAILAVDCGAAAIGINLIPGSARCRSPAEASAIMEAARGRICVVLLFADASASSVREACERLRPDLLQFHGDESPDFCQQFSMPYLKALRANSDLAAARLRYAEARGWLVDATAGGQFGGTGETFDWGLFPREPAQPWILAGGLDPENVGHAVEAARPWAVDVSSGVERDPKGIKDAARVRAFCTAVAAADQRLGGAVG